MTSYLATTVRFSACRTRVHAFAIFLAIALTAVVGKDLTAQQYRPSDEYLPREQQPASVLVQPRLTHPANEWPANLSNGFVPDPPVDLPRELARELPRAAELPATEELQQLITQIARQHIPVDFEDTKKWGMQAERWDGIKFERDGLRVETRRRKKMVNHGNWSRYKAYLIDPDQQMHVRIENLHRQEDDRIAFHVDFVARIGIDGRVSKWVKGVQMYSFSAEGTAVVELRVDCLLDTKLDFSRLPPDLVFVPEVTNAELKLVEFDLNRVSKAGGELADQLGKAAEKKLQKKLDEKADKLVDKANKSIEKKQDKLRLSAADFLASRWSTMADKLLPKNTVERIRSSESSNSPLHVDSR